MDINYNIYNDVRTTWKNKYLANIYGVTEGCIQGILSKRNWSWVK